MIEFVICVWYFQCMGRTPNTGLGTLMSLYAPEFIQWKLFLILFSVSLHVIYLDGSHSINKIQRASQNSLMYVCNCNCYRSHVPFRGHWHSHYNKKHNVAPRNVYTKANTMNVNAVQ